MKKYLTLLILGFAAANMRGADIITLWNFNSAPPDANLNTGTLSPSAGAGTVTFVGGVTNGFLGGHTTDPADSGGDNSAINTGSYPASGTGDKTAGARFTLSTVGYQNIKISWALRGSGTASRFYRVQYSTDGVNFLDSTNLITITSASTYSVKTADLSYISGVTNNPNFAFQIVSEFTGGTNYTAVSGTYGVAGVVRFDMMTVSGDPFSGLNVAPTISTITNVVMRVDTSTVPIPFVIGDLETAAVDLTVVKGSSNPTLIPNAGLVLGGSASNRTVTITPAAGQTGLSVITLGVIDAGGKSNNIFFNVTVLPTNTPPTISTIANQGTVVSTPSAAIAFTVGDLETATSNLTVTAVSSNLTLLPNSGIALGGSNASRTITLTPAAGLLGSALVRITVSDGTFTTNRTFILAVTPSVGTLLYEPFDYADGALVTVSGGLWSTHSGTTGQLQVISHNIYLTSDNSEDVNATLRGEPYATATGTNLYYSFFFAGEFVPSVIGDYLAHFKDNANNFRARLNISITNATVLGNYRVGILNAGASAATAGYAEVPIDLVPGETNRFVVRYNVGTGISTVWLNPIDELSASYSASDTATPNSVTQFAFRESNFIGTGHADELRVATTFSEVLGILPVANISLKIFRSGSDVVVSWPTAATGFTLQSCDSLTTTNWQNVVGAPVVVGSENFVTNSAPSGDQFFRLKN